MRLKCRELSVPVQGLQLAHSQPAKWSTFSIGTSASLQPPSPSSFTISHPFLSAFVRIRTFRPAALFASASASTFLASVLIDHTVSLPSLAGGRGKLTWRDRRCPRVPLATSSICIVGLLFVAGVSSCGGLDRRVFEFEGFLVTEGNKYLERGGVPSGSLTNC